MIRQKTVRCTDAKIKPKSLTKQIESAPQRARGESEYINPRFHNEYSITVKIHSYRATASPHPTQSEIRRAYR